MAPFLDADSRIGPARPQTTASARAEDHRVAGRHGRRLPGSGATCGHAWSDELTPDADCLLGCGLAYGEWSEGDGAGPAEDYRETKVVALIALGITQPNIHTTIAAATAVILAVAGGSLLVAESMLASRQEFYQRGQLDGWIKGWSGQPTDVTDPLLRG